MSKMNYEMFKEAVSEYFIGYMPEEYRELRVYIHPVHKINRVLDGLSLIGNDGIGETFSVGDNTKCSPTIYVNQMYDDYLKGDPITLVMGNAAKAMVTGIREITTKKINLNVSLDESIVKDNIIFQLINTAQNKDMLANVPHREFLDLSIIYRWVVKVDEDGIQSAVIKNDIAGKLGMSELQLYTAAVNNTMRILPPIAKPLSDKMREILMSDGMPAEIAEMMVEVPSDAPELWVITNNRNLHGANSMLYEDKLHELAMKLNSDLYILPSSVHEVIAVAVSTFEDDPNELAKMVATVNEEQVALDERLSNQVYHYSKDLRILSFATMGQNEHLDNYSDIKR